MLDSPAEMLRAVCSYLGRIQFAKRRDLPGGGRAEDQPYIRNFSSSEYIEALANGDLCISWRTAM